MVNKINEMLSVTALKNLDYRRVRGADDEGVARDAVSVSDFAKELAEITGELKKIPEIRENLVQKLKQEVEAGTYQLRTSNVAALLLQAGIFKKES